MGLAAQGEGRIGVPGNESHRAEKPDRERDHAVVALPAVHAKAFFERPSRRLEVAENNRERPDHRLRLRAGARRAGAEREQLPQALTGLVLVAPHLPEAPECRADPETDLRLACFDRPGERGADVVPLRVETLEPLALLRAPQARLGFFGEHEVEACVSTPDGLAVAAVRPDARPRTRGWSRAFPGEARPPLCRLGSKQVLLEERLDAVQDVEPGLLGDELGAAQRETPDEDGEAREELLLLRVEELVAPVDRRAQRPLALGQTGTRHRLQQLEPAAEPLEDRAR